MPAGRSMSATSPRSALPTATDLPGAPVPHHEDGGEPERRFYARETDAMALTPIGLCSRALIKIGAGSITSFNDGTAEAEVADALYSSTRDALLSANSWSFALHRRRWPCWPIRRWVTMTSPMLCRLISCGRCPQG